MTILPNRTERIGIPVALALAAMFVMLRAAPGELPDAARQQAGGVLPAEQKFHVVRSISGTKGVPQGARYIIEDPRTTFHVPDDRQVIVYFEWEGPPGLHHFQGLWKNPDGKVTVISDFDYEAKEKRFGGYWSLVLAETAPTGLWTLEARVDGEVTGSHSFEIVAFPRPASAIPTRRILEASEAYRRAVAASVFIEKLDGTGQRLDAGSGFFIGEGLVVTAFQVIDGASRLRLVLPDGRSAEANQVVAWNRWQDWVVLKTEFVKTLALPRAQSNSWKVGDHCYSLDSPAEGNHVIVDADIIGTNNFPRAGERLNLSFFPTTRAIGSPLLNEYGELIGVVGGGLLPGVRSLEGTKFGYPSRLLASGVFTRGGLATPITLIPYSLPADAAKRLEELARGGQFVEPLAGDRNVMFGSVARRVDRKGPVPQPVDEKTDFSRRESEIAVLLNWFPKEKTKSQTSLRVYDLDNRLLVEGKPAKIELTPNHAMATAWQLPIVNMPPGIYRVDVLLGQSPVWRTFFRITE